MLSNNMSLVRTCGDEEHRRTSGDVVVVVVVGLEIWTHGVHCS